MLGYPPRKMPIFQFCKRTLKICRNLNGIRFSKRNKGDVVITATKKMAKAIAIPMVIAAGLFGVSSLTAANAKSLTAVPSTAPTDSGYSSVAKKLNWCPLPNKPTNFAAGSEDAKIASNIKGSDCLSFTASNPKASFGR